MAFKIKALQQFRSDDQLEAEGKWADIAEDIQFRVRRMRSKPVMDAREKIYGPYERAQRGQNKLPDAIEVQCTINLLSQAVVADWRQKNPAFKEKDAPADTPEWLPHLLDDDGQPIEFSADNASVLFSDKETGKDLRGLIINIATDADFYAPEEIAADLGNSGTS